VLFVQGKCRSRLVAAANPSVPIGKRIAPGFPISWRGNRYIFVALKSSLRLAYCPTPADTVRNRTAILTDKIKIAHLRRWLRAKNKLEVYETVVNAAARTGRANLCSSSGSQFRAASGLKVWVRQRAIRAVSPSRRCHHRQLPSLPRSKGSPDEGAGDCSFLLATELVTIPSAGKSCTLHTPSGVGTDRRNRTCSTVSKIVELSWLGNRSPAPHNFLIESRVLHRNLDESAGRRQPSRVHRRGPRATRRRFHQPRVTETAVQVNTICAEGLHLSPRHLAGTAS
jgi:hypothetical protein